MVCMIHHCNLFVLVRQFVEKWTYEFSLMIKEENVGVNTRWSQSKLWATIFDLHLMRGLIGAPPRTHQGSPPVCGAQQYKGGDHPKKLILRLCPLQLNHKRHKQHWKGLFPSPETATSKNRREESSRIKVRNPNPSSLMWFSLRLEDPRTSNNCTRAI